MNREKLTLQLQLVVGPSTIVHKVNRANKLGNRANICLLEKVRNSA